MSEQDKKGGGGTGGSGGSTVMVDQSPSNRESKPYRPTELHGETASDLHKRSKAPAVPSVTEELKDISLHDQTDTVERIDTDRAMSSEKQMTVSKKLSSKRRGSSPEDIKMVPIDTAKKDIIASPTPIPAHIETVISEVPGLDAAGKRDAEKRADDDSITEEITELRTPEAAVQDHSEWSDDEEAGGLPRSESRASRVSRAVRQMFCCGVTYHAPSEEDIPAREFNAL